MGTRAPVSSDTQTVSSVVSEAASAADREALCRSSRHFATDHLLDDLKGRSVRGGAATVLAQAVRFALNMGSTMMLARLLTPADFGLVAMVAAFIGFIGLFNDLGLSTATVQRAEITHDQVSTLFWVNVTLSLVLMVVAVALAPAVAWIYGEPRLTSIMLVIAVTFICAGLTAQHTALLRRQMRFGVLAAIDVLSTGGGIVVALVMALREWGYWSLVGMTVAGAAVNMVLVWRHSRWRPGRPLWTAEVWPMLRFGGNLTGFELVNYCARNADNALIGWCWGAGPLGLYSKAYNLLMMPLRQISAPLGSVLVPALSRLNDQPDRYRRVYLNVIEKIALATVPGIALLIATADWVVYIVLGPNWVEAGRVFKWLGIAALVQPVTNTTGWLFVSQGRAGDMLRWGIIGGPLVIASFIIGLPWGAMGVAIAYAVTTVCIATPMLLWIVGRQGPVRSLDVYRVFMAPAAAAIAIPPVIAWFRIAIWTGTPLGGLMVATAIGVTVTVFAYLAFPSGRRVLGNVFAYVRTPLGLVRLASRK